MSFRSLALVVGALLLVGCASSGPEVVTDDPEALTHDGLAPVRGARMDRVWVRPGLDLTPYEGIIFQGAGIAYRPVDAQRARRGMSTRSGTTFPLTEAQRSRLQGIVRAAFEEELAQVERFEIVGEPGPGVLLLRGGLIDVVSLVPPERAASVDVYLRSVGEATLVLELVDSESGAVLVRTADRRAAERRGYMMEANPVTSWAEVRRLANAWASLLRERLDGIDEVLQ